MSANHDVVPIPVALPDPFADIREGSINDKTTQHCCEIMTSNVNSTCDQHADRHNCPECLIDFWPNTETYGIMVHDGGGSMIVISHCPWCGTLLLDPADRPWPLSTALTPFRSV